ncbi:MAG TPA: M48 family metallopeptidase [Fulvivirga sp.]|nr:M48 family metallopeptidase [Fulvivirga sp.]
MKTLRDLAILLLVFGGIWIAFTYWPVSSFKTDSTTDLTFGNEDKLADLMRDQIENKYEELEDSLVVADIDLIFQRIVSHLDSPKYKYNISLLESSEVNAFATFNGDVYILSGLIKFAETPEEVAAVLAHEIGHHEKQHVQKRLVKELGLTVLLAIATGGDPGVISEVFKMVMSTKFDRGQEKEADNFAYQLLEKSGINPNHMATFFIRMKREKNELDQELQFISTHPANKERIQDAIEYKLADDFKEVSIGIDWSKVKEHL